MSELLANARARALAVGYACVREVNCAKKLLRRFSVIEFLFFTLTSKSFGPPNTLFGSAVVLKERVESERICRVEIVCAKGCQEV